VILVLYSPKYDELVVVEKDHMVEGNCIVTSSNSFKEFMEWLSRDHSFIEMDHWFVIGEI